MNRRDLLIGGAALAGAALSAAAVAGEHAHHQHGASNALAAALADCIQKGQVCQSHCLDLLADGEKSMAACAKSVNQMLTLCSALQQLANQQSQHTAKLAGLALKACRECEEECKKHADKHEACKACGESCKACATECEKVAA